MPSDFTLSERQSLVALMVENKSALAIEGSEKAEARKQIVKGFKRIYPNKFSHNMVHKKVLSHMAYMIRECAIEKPGSYAGFARYGERYIKRPVGTANDPAIIQVTKPNFSAQNAHEGSIRRAGADAQSTVSVSTLSNSEVLPARRGRLASANGRIRKWNATAATEIEAAATSQKQPHFLDDADIPMRMSSLLEKIKGSASAFVKGSIRSKSAVVILRLIGAVSDLGADVEDWTSLRDRKLFNAISSRIVYAWVLSRQLISYEPVSKRLKYTFKNADLASSTFSTDGIIQNMRNDHLHSTTLRSKEIPAKAKELAAQLRDILDTIFEYNNARSAELNEIFKEAMELRLDLDLKNLPSKLTWPHPGQRFDESHMSVENAEDFDFTDLEDCIVQFAMTPTVSRENPFTKGNPRTNGTLLSKEAVLAKALVYLREPAVDTRFMLPESKQPIEPRIGI